MRANIFIAVFISLFSGLSINSSEAGFLDYFFGNNDPYAKLKHDCDNFAPTEKNYSKLPREIQDQVIEYENDDGTITSSVYIEKIDLPLAIKICEQARIENSNTPRFSYILGRLYRIKGDYERSQIELNFALNRGEGLAALELAKIVAEKKQKGWYQETAALFDKATKLEAAENVVDFYVTSIFFGDGEFSSTLIGKIYYGIADANDLNQNFTYIFFLERALSKIEECRRIIPTTSIGENFEKAKNKTSLAEIYLGKSLNNGFNDAKILHGRGECADKYTIKFLEKLRDFVKDF